MMELIKIFTTFDELITAKILRFLNLAGIFVILALTVTGVFGSLFGNMHDIWGRESSRIYVLGSSLLGGAAGLVAWRILLEWVFVLFGIYERLGQIQKRLPRKRLPQP
jgi:hypothetical protein